MQSLKPMALSQVFGLMIVLNLCLLTEANSDQAPIQAKQVDESRPLLSEEKQSEILGKLSELFDRLPLKYKLDETSTEGENLGYGVFWERRVEPAYMKETSVVIDQFQLNARYFEGGEIGIEGETGSTLTFGPTGTIDVTFARNFEAKTFSDRAKLLFKAPYNPFKDLPTTAKKALNRIKVGDMVFARAQMSLFVRGQHLAQFVRASSLVTIVPYAQYMITGEFDVHIFKREDGMFRLKLIGIQSNEKSFGLYLGHQPAKELKIFEVKLVGKRIRKEFEFSPISIAASLKEGASFMIDYLIDLKNPEAQRAYDQVMGKFWSPKVLEIFDPRKSREELRQMLVVDIDPLEQIFDQDKNKSTENRRVDRLFSGEMDFKMTGMNIQIGHSRIAKAGFAQNYSVNKITTFNRDNLRRYFLMPVFSMTDSAKMAFGFFNTNFDRTANLLLETGSDFTPTKMGELSFYMDYRDAKLEVEEIEYFKNVIRTRLPEDMYQEIDWKDWTNGKVNARLTMLMVFRTSIIEWLGEIDQQELYDRLLAYLDRFPSLNTPADPDIYTGAPSTHKKAKDRYHDSLNSIFALLVNFLEEKEDFKKRVDSFTTLRTIPLWQEIGSGFFVGLARDVAEKKFGKERGKIKFRKHFFFETQWAARNAETVIKAIGDCKNRKIYRAAMYLYSTINNRGPNLRLIDEDGKIPGELDKDQDYACNEPEQPKT